MVPEPIVRCAPSHFLSGRIPIKPESYGDHVVKSSIEPTEKETPTNFGFVSPQAEDH